MKRKKASASANEKHCKAKVEELGNCSSYADLPPDVITKIMLNYALPIESILICKCVCKNWKAVISTSDFAKFHHERAHVRYMFRNVECNKLVSRTLYLLPQISEIECKNHLKLKPRFKLPLRNGKSILDKCEVLEKSPIRAAIAKLRLGDKKAAAKSISDKYKSKRPIAAAAAANKLVLKKRPYIACDPNYMKSEIVNSCNGLLCLASKSPEGCFGPPIVICNPVTGEFITLPEPQYKKGWTHVLFGFGFEPKTNEYKVIRMSRTLDVYHFESSLFIEIYTLGTPTWRNVEVDPIRKAKARKIALRLGFNWKHEFPINWKHEFPTYMNGALHWIRFNTSIMFILCFNFESERLQSFPSPDENIKDPHNQSHGMGEVNGLLHWCYTSGVSNATMWAMKKYGDGESWIKAYSIDTLSKTLGMGMPNPSYCLCFPVKHPKEGAVAAMLFYDPCHDCFTYYVPERFGLKVLRLVGTQPERVEVIPHIPSLVSLKDIVKGDNIEVLNIHSRCAKLKLKEENEVLSLAQKIVDEDYGHLL